MNRTLIILISIITIVNINCNAQWIQTDGPYGKINVPAIFKAGSRVFAGTGCGLYENDGITSSWNLYKTVDVDVYDQKGDSVFFSGNYGGVNLLYLSGQQSEPVSKGLGSLKINAIKSTDTCLYAGAEIHGFFKSNGFSDSWIPYNEGLPTDTGYIPPKFGGGKYYIRYVYSIEIIGSELICGTNKGVYKSDMQNVTWTESNNGMPNNRVSILEVFNDTVFAGIGNAVYVSSDAGSSWSELFTAPSTIQSIRKMGGILYIATAGNGIYRSDKTFSAWSSLNSGLDDLNITTVGLFDSVLVCGSSSGGFHYYADNTWQTNIHGIICSSIRSMAVTSYGIIANDEDQVYLSYGGNTWADVSPDVDYELFGSVATMNDSIFLSVEYDTPSWPYDCPFILFSPDQGKNWENLIHPVPFARDDPYRIYCDNGTLYAYEDEIMYFTNNIGATWNEISLPVEYCNYFSDFIVYHSQPIASACGNSQLVTLSNNSDWILTNAGLPADREVEALAFTSDALYAYVNVHGMYVSRDSGQSWSEATNGLETDWGVRSFAYSGENIFVATEKGVYYSDNYGQYWHMLNEGLINRNVSSIEIFNDTLFAGTYGNGIWKHDIESIPLSVIENQGMKKHVSVYPNPASDNLTVKIPGQAIGELQLIDLMGRKIFLKSIETYNHIDISDIPNGSYLVIIKTKYDIYNSKLIISR